VLVPPADGITVERVTADTQQTWDRLIARGFAENGPFARKSPRGIRDLAG
jgi:hypothetical protein